MPDVMASLFFDVDPYEVKLTLFCDSNYFLIASMVSAYPLRQKLLQVIADGSTSSLRNALYDCPSSRFVIVLHGM